MELIRVERARKRMSQNELAKQMGVAETTIRRWEKGGNVPSGKLYPLAKILGVSIEELVTYDQEH